MPGPQRVPRPPTWRAGDPSPWLAPGRADRPVTIARVREALVDVGPDDPWPHAPPDARPSAVLVPLFEEGGEAHVVLTRRAATLRSHTGEVSFPGGRIDPGETAVEAALREAWEEVRIDPRTVEVIGELGPLSTASGRSAITPVVGALPGRPRLEPNPAEVERAFDVSLRELLADGVHWEERWDSEWGADRPIHFFDLPEDVIWGATARMLHQLLTLVART